MGRTLHHPPAHPPTHPPTPLPHHPERLRVYKELEPRLLELSKSPYGHHVVSKLISLAPKEQLPGAKAAARRAGGHAVEGQGQGQGKRGDRRCLGCMARARRGGVCLHPPGAVALAPVAWPMIHYCVILLMPAGRPPTRGALAAR